MSGKIYDIKNEKLSSLYSTVVELEEKVLNYDRKNSFTFGLPHIYYVYSKLGLFLAHFDTNLHYKQFENLPRYVERLEIASSMIRGKISDIVTELQIAKNKPFWMINFSVSYLRYQRDAYVEALHMYQVVLSVIQRLCSQGK